MANLDRLQFVKHEEVFATREAAVDYVLNIQSFERPSLLAEPMILLYESGSAIKGPNVILAVGSVGDGVTSSNANRTFFIDTQKTEEEIEELRELIEEAIKSLSIIPVDSDTIDLTAEKTENGTILSGDVKIADYRIIDGRVVENIIETEGDKGIYTFVDMDYDPETFVITFKTTKQTKEFQLPPDQHVVKGWYSTDDEAIYLKLADDSKIKIDVVKLIDEWTVLSGASTTPICLYKQHVSSSTESHDGVYDWQDILSADVRVADHIDDNIIHKDRTGRYLYVKGTADNIQYKNGQTVADALDNVDTKVSTSDGNLIYKRPDGIYAYAMLGYNTAENKLTYTYSDGRTEGNKTIEFQLNSVKLLEDITYDPVKEEIVIRYIDAQGEYQRVEIPVKDIIEEWDVLNEGHNIKLNKFRSEGQGKDILTADAKIYEGDNNILIDKNHELYVNGISDNIKYDVTGDTTVKDVLDSLSAASESTNDKLDEEIARATAAEQALDNKIDQEIADRIADVDEEQARAEAAEQALQDEIEAVSADSASSIKDIINVDKSINVDKTDPTKPVINVNISGHENNTIRLIQQEGIEGLFNYVNLDYDAEHNKLTFTRSTAGATDFVKEMQLESISFIDEIYYDKNTEELVIVYYSGHDRKEMRIPLRELIDEWDVYNDVHSAVVLTKEWNSGLTKDILSAEVRISSKADNILENQEGELYVSSSGITANADAIAAETTRAEAAEQALQNAIDAEVARATSAENALTNNLNNEIARSIVKDGELENAINAESQRAQSAEEVLNDKIGTGFTDDPHENVTAKFNELSSKTDSEIVRATAAESNLQTLINNEVTRATNAENSLNNAIEAETERAISAETSLRDSIAFEHDRAVRAEEDLSQAINNEINRASAAERNLSHLIDDETERRISGDTILNEKITTESTRARETETRLETAINNEISRAMTAEGDLNAAITNETLRAQAADNELYHDLADETAARAAGDSDLLSNINQEVSRAQVAENSISESLNSEITRSTAEDQRLNNALQQEITNRQQGDAELAQQILDATIKFSPSKNAFSNNGTIEFNNYENNNNIVEANVLLNEGEDNIIEIRSGLFASARLDYDVATNKIKLTTSAGVQEYQLAGATVIDNLYYDNESGEIVITYHDGSGNVQTVRFPATELFNEWIVNNPSEKSAVELTKTRATEQGQPDELKARVLITDDRDGDGKPDEGSDNIIEIRNNGLYVCGSAITEAHETAECVENELRVLEKAVIGHFIDEECGSGYTYEPNNMATYIVSAQSFNNADFILDQNIKRIDEDIVEIKEDVDCIDNKTDVLYGMLYTNASPMPKCGSGATYQPYQGACIISGATSFMEADQLLNDQICEILTMWVSGKTCSTESAWVEDGANRKMTTDVRISRGRFAEMTDDDVYITDLTGDYIDPTNTEFTDTNVLRIACIEEGPSGTTPSIDSMQNGVYLSNAWDCGLYYDEENDADAIAAASAAGYKTDPYRTDTSPEASNYNYMNNVRQNDVLGG